MIEIEKGVPLVSWKSCGIKYPFNDMEIGDSFFIPCDEGNERETRRRITIAVDYRRIEQKKYSVRQVSGGIRCWRIM